MQMALISVAVVMLGLHVFSCLIVAIRLCRPAPKPVPRQDAPCITLLRPVCGLDPQDAETLGSSFALDYPAFEVIFCAADGNDPVVPVVQALIAVHPAITARLLVGDDRLTNNPKLNNLAKGWHSARGGVIVMADSNLLLPRDYLWQLLAARVALVSSPPIGVRPAGVWAELECAFLNSNQARLQLVADEIGQGFAQGKTLMWERDFLNHAGGLAALGQRLAEDVAATRLVRKAGLRVALSRQPFAQPIGRRSFAQVWARQLRWSKVRREGFPKIFLAEPLNGAVMALLLAACAGGYPAALGVAAVWYGAEIMLALSVGWARPGLGLLMLPVRDVLIPLLWLATFKNAAFEWRGNAMAPGELAPLTGAQP